MARETTGPGNHLTLEVASAARGETHPNLESATPSAGLPKSGNIPDKHGKKTVEFRYFSEV